MRKPNEVELRYLKGKCLIFRHFPVCQYIAGFPVMDAGGTRRVFSPYKPTYEAMKWAKITRCMGGTGYWYENAVNKLSFSPGVHLLMYPLDGPESNHEGVWHWYTASSHRNATLWVSQNPGWSF